MREVPINGDLPASRLLDTGFPGADQIEIHAPSDPGEQQDARETMSQGPREEVHLMLRQEGEDAPFNRLAAVEAPPVETPVLLLLAMGEGNRGRQEDQSDEE